LFVAIRGTWPEASGFGYRRTGKRIDKREQGIRIQKFGGIGHGREVSHLAMTALRTPQDRGSREADAGKKISASNDGPPKWKMRRSLEGFFANVTT